MRFQSAEGCWVLQIKGFCIPFRTSIIITVTRLVVGSTVDSSRPVYDIEIVLRKEIKPNRLNARANTSSWIRSLVIGGHLLTETGLPQGTRSWTSTMRPWRTMLPFGIGSNSFRLESFSGLRTILGKTSHRFVFGKELHQRLPIKRRFWLYMGPQN